MARVVGRPDGPVIILWNKPKDTEAFERHCHGVHIPLAKKMAGLRRYTVSRDIAAMRGEPYYLVAELDWDDMAALQRASQSTEGRATSGDVARLSVLSTGVQSTIYQLEDV